jgi:hypothetical protein
MQHSYTLAHVLNFLIKAQEKPAKNVKTSVETFLRASCRLWLMEIWSSLYSYISSGGNCEIVIWIEFYKGPKIEYVTSNFKFIIKIMTLQTRVKLPSGDIYAHSVLSESLLTDSVSCSCWHKAPSYCKFFVCVKV